jgi:hypothetical protein
MVSNERNAFQRFLEYWRRADGLRSHLVGRPPVERKSQDNIIDNQRHQQHGTRANKNRENDKKVALIPGRLDRDCNQGRGATCKKKISRMSMKSGTWTHHKNATIPLQAYLEDERREPLAYTR